MLKKGLKDENLDVLQVSSLPYRHILGKTNVRMYVVMEEELHTSSEELGRRVRPPIGRDEFLRGHGILRRQPASDQWYLLTYIHTYILYIHTYIHTHLYIHTYIHTYI